MTKTLPRPLVPLLFTALVVAGLVATSPPADSAGRHGSSPHAIVNLPHRRASKASAHTFNCQLPTAAVRCYGPDQIRTAYDIAPVLSSGITGKGRTIVIVDAFGYPTLGADLHTFDTTFGLPDPTLNVIAPDGQLPFNPTDDNQVGWSGEIALDVEWAHAVAPDATIDLVIARTNDDADILSATKYAVDHKLGDVISQSFGEAESCVTSKIAKAQHQVFEKATQRGITLIASSGDQGAAQPTCDGNSYLLSASSPAADPLVLAVGGTQLNADPVTGAYIGEVAWNEPQYQVGSGGGFSTEFAKPFYQYGTVPGSRRGVPDVSYNAAINGGVLTAWSGGVAANVGQFYLFGGTSAGSPQWAGITALADQKAGRRLGFLNPAIYLIGHSPAYGRAFHDITTGNSTFVGQDANGATVTVSGYDSAPGWDPVTGWGSPDVGNLLALIPSAQRQLQS